MIFDQVLTYSFPLCTQNKLYNRMNRKALMFSGYNTGNNTLLNARFSNTFVERSFVAVNLATVCYQKKEKEINKNCSVFGIFPRKDVEKVEDITDRKEFHLPYSSAFEKFGRTFQEEQNDASRCCIRCFSPIHKEKGLVIGSVLTI